MGHKLLIIILLGGTILAKSPYPDIDQLIEKVKQKRVGLDPQKIKKLKNPFVNEKKLIKIIKKKIEKEIKKKKRKIFRLQAIFNDRAKINGRWYKLGSKIEGFKIVAIRENYVILQRGNKTLKLFLHKKRKSGLIKILKGRK